MQTQSSVSVTERNFLGDRNKYGEEKKTILGLADSPTFGGFP